MVSSYTTNKNIEKPASGDYPGAWAAPINANWDLLDSALGATLNLSGLTNSNVTLSRTQAGNLIVKCTGTLTGNITITWPAYGGIWVVDNQTTGSFSITAACAGGGSTVTCQQSARTIIMTDGTNARIADDRASSFTLTSSAMDGLFGTTQGNIIYRNATQWVSLGPGTSGWYLKTNGAGANPAWAAVATGSGTVTSVGSGNGLTGGPITGAGSLSVQASTGISVSGSGVAVSNPVLAYANISGTTVNRGFNVSGVTNPSAGNYTFSFSSSVPTNATFMAQSEQFTTAVVSFSTTSVNVRTINGGGSPTNASNVHLMVF